ncbi:MAG: hypothetical protein RLZZ381_3264 [Cyanobacteriota bacterium]|jgi:hypothetical protein
MKKVITSIFVFSLTATSVSAQEYIDMSAFGQINQGVQTLLASKTTQAEKQMFCNIDSGEDLTVKTYNIMANSSLNYSSRQMEEARRTYYHYSNACRDNSSAETTKKYYYRFVKAVDAAWDSIHN